MRFGRHAWAGGGWQLDGAAFPACLWLSRMKQRVDRQFYGANGLGGAHGQIGIALGGTAFPICLWLSLKKQSRKLENWGSGARGSRTTSGDIARGGEARSSWMRGMEGRKR